MPRSTGPEIGRRALLLGAASAALAAGPARAEAVVRIGYQKFNTLNILKGTGALEAALAPKGVAVKWAEFQAGPQLLEAMNAGSIDLGHAADAPSVFAQAAGVDFVYLAAEPPYPAGHRDPGPGQFAAADGRGAPGPEGGDRARLERAVHARARALRRPASPTPTSSRST